MRFSYPQRPCRRHTAGQRIRFRDGDMSPAGSDLDARQRLTARTSPCKPYVEDVLAALQKLPVSVSTQAEIGLNTSEVHDGRSRWLCGDG
jgi:hypothetical protein